MRNCNLISNLLKKASDFNTDLCPQEKLQTDGSFIEQSHHPFILQLTNTIGCCCCFVDTLWVFFQAQCAVDSASLFTLIKFNRPAAVPEDPEHAERQQSNADFHYLKLL